MNSPFPVSSSFPGRGNIHLKLLPPSTTSFSELSYTYPLKLLPSTPHTLTSAAFCPELESFNKLNSEYSSDGTSEVVHNHPRTPSSVSLVFLITYGGGLLAGDCIDLSIRLDPYTRLTIATQGSTKVYKTPASSSKGSHKSQSDSNNDESIIDNKKTLPFKFPTSPNPISATISRQNLNVRISPGAGLWVGPDPIQPFANSRYAQIQIFEVERGGSIGVLDWVSEGRRARGESWVMDGWKGRNEIWEVFSPRQNEGANEKSKEQKILMVRDSVILQPDQMTGAIPSLLASQVGVIGTLLFHGPLFASVATFFVSEFTALPRIGSRNWSSILTSQEQIEKDAKASAHERWRNSRQEQEKTDGVLWTAARVRGGVTVVKFAARELRGARVWLGDMLRQEGSVATRFGEGGLMFLR